MSTNPLFATKKRDISMLYGTSCVNANSSAEPVRVYPPCNGQISCPPSKRLRSANASKGKAMDEVFGDNEDFTADDLEEIDILASQAFTQDSSSVNLHFNRNQGKVLSDNQQSTSTFPPIHRPTPHRPERVVTNHRDNNAFGLEVLQSPLEDFNQKLTALQDDLLVKNGEIKVLRDALHQTEYSLEQQKTAHVQLENERTRLQSEKEKEFLKKVQSLQSELQFKDAEMNELKSKLQSCERRTALPQVSPKKSPSRATKVDSCSSPQRGKNSFPTKESFRANTSVRTSVPAPPQPTSFPGVKTGSILLNSLMQQSHPEGPFGLYHLLSGNLDVLQGSPVRRGHTSNTSGKSISGTLSSTQCLALKDAQKLAITGLNSIALGDDLTEQNMVTKTQRGMQNLNKMSRIPGAVLILPLVEFHIAAYCLALKPLEKCGASSSDNQSLSSSSTDRNIISSVEEAISCLSEPALASLGILYYLVFYSLDVVETLLLTNEEKRTQISFNPEAQLELCSLRNERLDSDEQNWHPLFKNIMFLLSSSILTSKRDLVREQALRVLVKLAENSPEEMLSRFEDLFTSSVLLQCLSAGSPLPIALNAVRLLALLADHKKLVSLFCSCSESCILLALYMYITLKPDKQASESLWVQFEYEVIRVQNKLITQGWNYSSSESGVQCQCNREVVKALVLTLHQEWLCVRRLILLTPTPSLNKSVQLLRETAMLLYSFFQKDKNFSENCLEVLHPYDQAVRGVRAILRKYNILKENEEFALDELCPPDVEAEDENMDCT
ncbi:ATR-interacting protein isoform X2 [Rana temporaria]|uniref:ATR-interacting protein isoform X2 n=1 Tax=Rana temporaria TaxID=8407 RepID=UPI001AAD8B22|nr:ATR-interacting protein isoform X2 [Rana temporaria]